MTSIVTRFAPSPTGWMHLGNARTALFNYCFAKQSQGQFLLRIEDTDKARSQTQYTDGLFADLRWMNCQWDGDVVFQSQRTAIYDDYFEAGLTAGWAYPCYCTETELALVRKRQLAAGQPPRYTGTCRHLSAAERETREARGIQPSLRFRVPDDAQVSFEDVIYGQKHFEAKDLGDFIIRKSDGGPSFMFANAIDDALNGVTHAFRGEDHLTNTPRQLLILQTLQLPQPTYGHMPIILGADAKPLSKRNGSLSIQDLKTQGILPEALNNTLARLGHYYGDQPLLSLDELSAQFKLSAVGRSPARYDAQQLRFWQKSAVAQLPLDTLASWIGDDTQALIASSQQEALLRLLQPEIDGPASLNQKIKALFAPVTDLPSEVQAVLAQTEDSFFDALIQAIEANPTDYQAVLQQVKAKTALKGKGLFQPLRAALTQALNGPQLSELYPLQSAHAWITRVRQSQEHARD